MDHVQVELGPSKSKLVAEAVDRFSDWLTAQGAGTATFRFDGSDEPACKDLLHAVSRLRKIRVTEGGTLFTRSEFLGELWRREREAKDAAWQAEYEAAGSCWPVPDEEFLSLACAAANGGDWDFDEEKPMSPKARQGYLDLFAGRQTIDPVVLKTVEAKLDEFAARDEHPSEREFAYSLNRSPYQLENEYRWAQERRGGEYQRGRAEASDAAIYFKPLCGCGVCRRLYLEEDGDTPRFFLPGELPAPGSNRGRPLEDWLPTMPPLHLHSFTVGNPLNDVSAHVEEFSFDGPTMVTRLPGWERMPLREAVPSARDPVEEWRAAKDRPPLPFGLKIEVEVVSSSAPGPQRSQECSARTLASEFAPPDGTRRSQERPDGAVDAQLPFGSGVRRRVGVEARRSEWSDAPEESKPGGGFWSAAAIVAAVAGSLVLAAAVFLVFVR